jgi:hypothetical protein
MLMINKKKRLFLPVIGFMQDEHFFANNFPKQSEQYGCSSLEVKRCPAND